MALLKSDLVSLMAAIAYLGTLPRLVFSSFYAPLCFHIAMASPNISGATSGTKPVIIGLYGVPGSGKSTMLEKLKGGFGKTQFDFFDGSEAIASLVSGGLAAFQQAPEEEKIHWRQRAIESIRQKSAESGRAAVVTGHFMFWSEGDEAGRPVYTQSDLDTYTHIVYLDTPPETVAEWRQRDPFRRRWPAPVEIIRRWQLAEKTELRQLCRDNGILFVALPCDEPRTTARIIAMLLDFRQHTEAHNLACAKKRLEDALAAHRNHCQGNLQTALVLDADRTLAAEDTGALFWRLAAAKAEPQSVALTGEHQPLKTLFGGALGHTYTAFRQATLLYEEAAADEQFGVLCHRVASSVTLYPEIMSLLKHAQKHDHVFTVVVTCGLRRVWEIVLARAGLSETVSVIGGGRVSDGFVVTGDVKKALITDLRVSHGLYVWAVGDSPLDLPMMHEAHRAIVVVGEEHARSSTMDEHLRDAIDSGGLRACQGLLPITASARLAPDKHKLPVVQLTDPEFLNSVAQKRDVEDRFVHATDRNSAKLLMTPTRDSRLEGPALREAHRRVGWYLATECLANVIGVEEYDIPHVQGHPTSGFRISHERKTTIVALMRGGEPMAFGVSDALPTAMFVHAKHIEDLELRHIKGQWTVILVDSVVNNGKTMVEFVERIRSLDQTISIVAVTGVVQAEAVSPEGLLGQALEKDRALCLVALRLSKNKYTGQGATDTGHRLFNTTKFN